MGTRNIWKNYKLLPHNVRIWPLLLQCCEEETSMFVWDVLKHGSLGISTVLHWHPPDSHYWYQPIPSSHKNC